MKRNNGIDLFRLICAFCVLIGHAKYGDLPAQFLDNMILAIRWVLPFFYMTSGYFLSRKFVSGASLGFHSIEKNIVHLISMLLIASLVYLPFEPGVLRQPEIAHLLNGSFYHLWFIGSMIVGYVFIWYAYFIGQGRLVPIASLGIIAAALFYDAYDHFLGIHLDFEFFRLLLSIPFMYLGYYLGKKDLGKKQLPFFIALLVIGYCVLFAEGNLLWDKFQFQKTEPQFLFGSLLISVAFFGLAVVIKVPDNKLSKWGCNYALFMYLYHPLVYILMPGVLERVFPARLIGTVEMFNPLIGFVIVLAGAAFMHRYMNRLFNLLNGNLIRKKPLQEELQSLPLKKRARKDTSLPMYVQGEQ